MKLPQIVLGAFFTLGFLSPVDAADVAAGKVKAMFVCADCHGATGISVVANFPNLAGQKEMYLVAQLKAFRDGKRRNPEMKFLVKLLSAADIANVAAYFASLDCAPKGTAN